ncbi:MAG TPA: permease-like cell division protein FtsX [Actinomycetota bacterium]|jgi:cell division transport system permease protein
MRLDYYFRETATGLRRNGIVAFGAVSTSFIALFLFGLALLIYRELNLVIFNVTENVEVAVYLKDGPDHSDPPQDTVVRLTGKLASLPAVASVTYQSKDEAYERFKELFAGKPVFTENVSPDAIPASLRVHLTDTGLFDQIKAALDCNDQQQPNGSTKLVCTEPGVDTIADFSTLLEQLTQITRLLSLGVLSIAIVMLFSAIVLIANTLRMGMFARRREIGIMRLVGATNWRIRIPFLIEGMVESLVGAGLAVLALFVLKVTVIDGLSGQIRFFPFVRNSDVLAVAPWMLLASVFVAIVAGTIGIRRFLDV